MSKSLTTIRAELRDRPTDELVRELIGLIGYAAAKLQRMAFIVAELESRGHSTAAIRDVFLMRQLRRIAAGDLLPEVVEHFLGHPTIVDALARLPVAEQRRLLDCGKVNVLIGDTIQPIDLKNLTREAIAVAFGDGHIRTEAEQRQFLLPAVADKPRAPIPALNPAPPPVNYRVQPVPERHGIKIGNTFARAEEVVPALSELAGPLPEVDDLKLTETITLKVTSEQKAKLRAACKRTGKLEWRLILEAVHAYGLI